MLSPAAIVVGSTGLGGGRSPSAIASAESGETVSWYFVLWPRYADREPPTFAPLASAFADSFSVVWIERFCQGQPLASSVVGVRSTLSSPLAWTETPLPPFGA